MEATDFLMKTLKRIRTEMALSVLACNLLRVMNILGTGLLMAAMRVKICAVECAHSRPQSRQDRYGMGQGRLRDANALNPRNKH
jgi:hypothetical protein